MRLYSEAELKKRIEEKFAAKKRHRIQPMEHPPRYDEVYFRGIRDLDEGYEAQEDK